MKRIEILKVSNYKFREVVEIEEKDFFKFLNDLHEKYNEDLIIEYIYGNKEDFDFDVSVKIYDDYNE